MLKGKGAPPLFLARPRKRAYRKKARSTGWLAMPRICRVHTKSLSKVEPLYKCSLLSPICKLFPKHKKGLQFTVL